MSQTRLNKCRHRYYALFDEEYQIIWYFCRKCDFEAAVK